ncbi:MAG TPA: hypothetical protein VMX55_13475 [candidate division Zixibacteria bacterium]|nr:hypothetical protein [candidate division Zixibacteria bacterium]
MSNELIETKEEIEEYVEDDATDDKSEAKIKRFKLPEIHLPKWALITLMIVPAAIFIAIILLVDIYVGFPEKINPIAVISLVGVCLVGIVVISDMAYRNYFSYRMVRRESAKSKIYKDIIRERQEKKSAEAKFEFDEEDEYEYEEDEEEIKAKQKAILEEYDYEEIEDDEQKYYRMKSLLFRGGIFSILIVNGLIILVTAFILQLTYGGGFNIPAG